MLHSWSGGEGDGPKGPGADAPFDVYVCTSLVLRSHNLFCEVTCEDALQMLGGE